MSRRFLFFVVLGSCVVAGLSGSHHISAARFDADVAPRSQASVFQLATLNYVRFYLATDPNSFYTCQETSGIPCDGLVQAPGTNWVVNYRSTSEANYGVLRGTASVFLTGDGSLGPFPSFVSVGGRSGFLETLTVSGGCGTGTMRFLFQVTGTSGATAGANGRPQFQWVPVVNGTPNFGLQRNYAVNSGGMATVSFPVTFDTPTSFGIYFYALAQVFNWLPGASAFADYDSTAVLVGIVVEDCNGTPISDFEIQSASGTSYSTSGVVQAITIDVKPGEGVPVILTQSNGFTPVAILSSATFSAPAVVDLETLTFGRSGLETAPEACGTSDVNGDGLPDLMCRFKTDLAGFQVGDTIARLQGFTVGGTPIAGVDEVRVVR